MQMMWGDRGGETRITGQVCITDEINSLLGGDVLQHDAQGWITLAQGNQVGFDECSFAIKHIHITVSDLAMDEQRHVDGLHSLQHLADPGQIAHTSG